MAFFCLQADKIRLWVLTQEKPKVVLHMDFLHSLLFSKYMHFISRATESHIG